MVKSPRGLRVSDIAPRGCGTIESTASLVAADQAMRDYGHSVLAVLNNDRFIGTLSRHDLDAFREQQPEQSLRASKHTFSVAQAMNVRVAMCNPNERVAEALRRCILVNAEYLLSIDQHNTLHGVIGREDLRRATKQLHARVHHETSSRSGEAAE